VLEAILLLFSVRLSFKKRRRITYRMLKTRITTAEQNNEMWSSDDKDYTNETKLKKNSSFLAQDDENASFEYDDQEEDGTAFRYITSRSKSGIYEVDFTKPYKPIFLVFCDLVGFVGFLIFAIL
jgi:hypothetical protein